MIHKELLLYRYWIAALWHLFLLMNWVKVLLLFFFFSMCHCKKLSHSFTGQELLAPNNSPILLKIIVWEHLNPLWMDKIFLILIVAYWYQIRKINFNSFKAFLKSVQIIKTSVFFRSVLPLLFHSCVWFICYHSPWASES